MSIVQLSISGQLTFDKMRVGSGLTSYVTVAIFRLEVDLQLEVQCRNVSIFALTC